MSSRAQASRLRDIAEAISAIRRHLERGTIEDPTVFDACRMRLVEIGEAVKLLSPATRNKEPGIEWSSIARMRDRLVHHYKSTDAEIIDEELDDLLAAAGRLHADLTTPADQTRLDDNRKIANE